MVKQSGFDYDLLRRHQAEFLEFAQEQRHVFCGDDMGLGKGHPVGTRLLTPSGWATIENLREGDYVVGADGKPTKVTAIYDRGVIPTYKVTMSDGSGVVVDGDHLWQVNTPVRKRRRTGHMLRTTSDLISEGLTSGSNRKWFIPMVAPVEFDADAYLPIDPWLLGVLIGDGNYTQGVVTITKASDDLYDKVEECIPDYHHLKRIDKLTYAIRTSFIRNEVVRSLKSLGLHGQRSYEKHIPDVYLWASVQDRIALLQGLLDTDSEINGSTVQHSTSSPKLAEQVRFLVQSLGGTTSTKERTPHYIYKGEKKHGRVNYRTTINLGSMQMFRTATKIEKYTPKTKRVPTRAIDSIEYVGNAQVYCISVDAADNLYVTEDFIVTHNTYEGIALDAVRRYQAETSNGKINGTKTLVVAPLTGVVDSWVRHFELLTDLVVRRVSTKDKASRLVLVDEMKDPGVDVIVVHWEALQPRLGLLDTMKQTKWLHIIADEAHRCKNRKAQQTKGLKAIKKVAFKTAMTGTPMKSHPDDAWSILHWLYGSKASRQSVWGDNEWAHSLLRSYWNFYNEFIDFYMVQGYYYRQGTKNEKKFRKLIAPVYMRRTKEDRDSEGNLIVDLPPKYYSQYFVDLYPKQRKAYDDMRKDMVAWLGPKGDTPLSATVEIAKLQRLQQMALAHCHVEQFEVEVEDEGRIWTETHTKVTALELPSSKVDALLDILDDAGENKVVVFSQFSKMIDLAAQVLHDNGYRVAKITGGIKQDTRSESIQEFLHKPYVPNTSKKQRDGQGIQVMLCTIGAGGTGIDMYAATTCVFLDRAWSPSDNRQAEDRLHRIGQTKPVQYIDIMANDTVDRGRKQKIDRKASWIRNLLEGKDDE